VLSLFTNDPSFAFRGGGGGGDGQTQSAHLEDGDKFAA